MIAIFFWEKKLMNFLPQENKRVHQWFVQVFKINFDSQKVKPFFGEKGKEIQSNSKSHARNFCKKESLQATAK